jgi:antagonist of KipI
VIAVVKPGLLTTVQDAGRPGLRAFGMPVAGAMDRHAFTVANLLAGNAGNAAALELTLFGGTFRFEAPAYVALAGADMRATLDGEPVRPWTAFHVRAGAALALGSAAAGVRAYVAVHGGVAVPPVLGSRSTYARAAVGGLEGRALRAGDRLPVGAGASPPSGPRSLSLVLVPKYPHDVTLRVLLGPQADRFTLRGIETLVASRYAVTARNDRMGYRLEGPAVEHLAGADIVSDALLPGAVQVPGNGMPVVIMADGQTVGGYAKVATVIGPDLAKLAQVRAGDAVRFVRCERGEAVEALRAERAAQVRLAAVLAMG